MAVLGAAVAALVVVLAGGESDHGSEATLAQSALLEHEGPAGTEAGDEATAESQHENSPGDLGGEAPREGPRSPVGELVQDRAYPKSYVNDRLALKGSRAFKRLPSSAPASSFRSPADYKAPQRGPPQSGRALGPAPPAAPAEATHFFTPATGAGTPTTNSGRVTAMAIDPNCGKPRQGCRV